ncbi:hypothetical protein [Neptuniibacter halophilus]|uniref:hypothetical protein n=1 Tax=Neptuniibacter halophilus TaxID=651666 RepID=UPI0025737777|nr:hypothetical protein [Neptuniibacter halophilus]
MFRLVKDFEEFQFVFYWIDDDANKVSPNLRTLIHAKEWLVEYDFKQRSGTERRQRKADRRMLTDSKKEGQPSSRRITTSVGRRASDRPIKIDLDLSADKLKNCIDTSESA